ncbi:MAG TPA: type II toxin-antitoxin system VapC family toxin [Rhizomicrobium sp.]|jgi:ribonuclease VapC|nr:type II toxin-antitoxin system VapC family toxin [Rhizomicrobium sp.]
MFVDASALLAILLKEPDSQRFSRAMENAGQLFTSPVAVFEIVCAVMRERACSRREAQRAVEQALRIANIEVVPITREIGDLALEAFEKYGKGRGHKAQLNMGDCFSYACSKSLGVALLYKGNDFAATDLA